MRKLSTACSIAVMVFAFLPSSAKAQSYEILLTRPTKPGASYRLVASGTESEKSSVTAGEQVVEQKAEERSVELTALVTVLEVNGTARPSRAKLVIEKSMVKKEADSKPVLPPGTEVVVSIRDNKDAFEVGGTAVEDDVAKALSVVFSLPKSRETDDEIFGTSEKKRVGDSWPLNAAAAVRSLKDIGFVVEEKNVKGGGVLKGVTTVGQVECLEVQGWFDLNSIALSLPGGFTVHEGVLQARFTRTVPTNKTLGSLADTAELSFKLRATGKPDPNGPEITLKFDNQKKLVAKTTPLGTGK